MRIRLGLLTLICVFTSGCRLSLVDYSYSEDIDKPHFSFGVIADCQYCNIKVPKDATRQYALSKIKLAKCVEEFNQIDLEFVVHLGDFIDRDFSSFEDVLPVFNRLRAMSYHVLGNHDFSVADELKSKVPKVLGLNKKYYQFRKHGYRFVVLDGNDVSLHAYPSTDPRKKYAADYHKTLPSGTPLWNGALGKVQLDWLEAELQDAKKVGDRVILFCHFPVYPENIHNLWNAGEVLSCISRFKNVVAYMNGHNHAGGYGEVDGQHFLTLKGMVDSHESAYSVVNVYRDRLEISGFGRQKDMNLTIKNSE